MFISKIPEEEKKDLGHHFWTPDSRYLNVPQFLNVKSEMFTVYANFLQGDIFSADFSYHA